MTVAFYLNCVSAHQLPLAKEVAKLVGAENFCYVDAGEKSESAQKVDVETFQSFRSFKVARLNGGGGGERLDDVDLLLTGMRDLELFERRAKKGLKTYYASERWYKPFGFEIGVGERCRCRVELPGFLRMLAPGYRRMVKRFVKWANEDPNGYALTYGPWAGVDFRKMGVRADKIIPWGYFVSPGVGGRCRCRKDGEPLKILWVGRMLALKRVETIIRAVARIREEGRGKREEVRLTLVGDGPERANLIKLAQRLFPDDVAIKQSNNQNNPNNQTITFLPSQPMERVRELMREHDVFVLASNGYEGWGAVVSEALEEGMRVLASQECGAGAALLPRERLFHSGDWKMLAQLIEKDMRGELPPCSIGEWTAESGARRLVGLEPLNGGQYRNRLI